jgi:hypothetical protein
LFGASLRLSPSGLARKIVPDDFFFEMRKERGSGASPIQIKSNYRCFVPEKYPKCKSNMRALRSHKRPKPRIEHETGHHGQPAGCLLLRKIKNSHR